MKNKGFTLIELLAVIVILAIIALIATPIVLDIINESRENAKVNSAQYVIDGVQTAYAVAYSKNHVATGAAAAKTAGETPYIENIALDLGFKNATVTTDGTDSNAATKLTVLTSDKVTCEFTRTLKEGSTTEYILKSDTCGFTEDKVKITEIGTVK